MVSNLLVTPGFWCLGFRTLNHTSRKSIFSFFKEDLDVFKSLGPVLPHTTGRRDGLRLLWAFLHLHVGRLRDICHVRVSTQEGADDAVDDGADAGVEGKHIVPIHQGAPSNLSREILPHQRKEHRHDVEHDRLHAVEPCEMMQLEIFDDRQKQQEEDDERRKLATIVNTLKWIWNGEEDDCCGKSAIVLPCQTHDV